MARINAERLAALKTTIEDLARTVNGRVRWDTKDDEVTLRGCCIEIPLPMTNPLHIDLHAAFGGQAAHLEIGGWSWKTQNLSEVAQFAGVLNAAQSIGLLLKSAID